MSLSPAEIAYEKANVNDDRRGEVIAATVVCGLGAILAVALRFLSRRHARAYLGADDWLLVASLVLYMGFLIAAAVQIHFGFGRHMILIQSPYGVITTFITSECFYMLIVNINKIAILCLYRRVFPQPILKRIFVATGAVLVGHSVAGFLASLTQCIPLAHYWDPEVPGTCANQLAFVIAMGIVTVITDFIVLALPIFPLLRLQVSKTRRVQLIIVFLFGGLTCIVSIVRIVYSQGLFGIDATYNGVPEYLAATVECSASFVCASAPTYRVLVNRYLRKNSTVTTVNSSQSPPKRIRFDSFKLHTKAEKHRGWFGMPHGGTRINSNEEKPRIVPSSPIAVRDFNDPNSHDWTLRGPQRPVSQWACPKEWAVQSAPTSPIETREDRNSHTRPYSLNGPPVPPKS